MVSIYDVPDDEWATRLAAVPRYRRDQLLEGLWSGADLDNITSLPAEMRQALRKEFAPALTVSADEVTDEGDTRKWVFTLHDGATIETVLMMYDDRVTVCVSSQAGCAMNCSFCATGQAGFTRQLTFGEVIEQIFFARRAAEPRRLSNVVFMGMGEPLANYDTTVRVVRALRDRLGLSARHLTVSTVGVAPAIERLADEGIPVTLAVSLHAAIPTVRDELVPLNRRYDLQRLQDACEYWDEKTKRRISFEYALIDGVNDTDEAARALAEYASPLRAHINLIPLNPTPGYLVRGSSMARVHAFRDALEIRGLNVSVRDTRGRSIAAACGQLAQVTRGKRSAVRLGRSLIPEVGEDASE